MAASRQLWQVAHELPRAATLARLQLAGCQTAAGLAGRRGKWGYIELSAAASGPIIVMAAAWSVTGNCYRGSCSSWPVGNAKISQWLASQQLGIWLNTLPAVSCQINLLACPSPPLPTCWLAYQQLILIWLASVTMHLLPFPYGCQPAHWGHDLKQCQLHG